MANEYIFNGVVINRKPEHFRTPKIPALAKVKDADGRIVYSRVALDRHADIDNINYFPYDAKKDSYASKQVAVEVIDETVTEPQADDAWVQIAKARFEELKGERAWLKPSLRGEYLELKEKLAAYGS